MGLDIGTLEAIKYDEKDQSSEALANMLYTAIQQNPSLTWRDLAYSLEAPNVGAIVKSL